MVIAVSENDRARVLFVDDESDLLNALKRALRRKQSAWEMLFAQSAAQALDICRSKPCQVVVTDLLMPDVNGIELIRTLNRDYPDTRCLMLSGTAGLDDAAEAINTTRIFRFFSKPCDNALLIKGIEDALGPSPQRNKPPTLQHLMQRFELTRSEARLTQALVMGSSLEDSAAEMGITPSSARTYLKRVFSKTGCSRQAELVSQVLRAL
jgi:DNA-binding NarL/FixJ family response regulator